MICLLFVLTKNARVKGFAKPRSIKTNQNLVSLTVPARPLRDLIAVDADPLKDVRAPEDIGFVMKGGQVVKISGKSAL